MIVIVSVCVWKESEEKKEQNNELSLDAVCWVRRWQCQREVLVSVNSESVVDNVAVTVSDFSISFSVKLLSTPRWW